MKHNTSSFLSLALFTLFCAGGCAGSLPAAPPVISSGAVGHWVGTDPTHWVELTNRGAVAIVTGDRALVGNYTTQGETIAPKFAAIGTSKPSRSTGLWQMHWAKDKLQVINPEKHVDEYQRGNPDPTLKDSPLLGRWEWTRKGTSHANSLEFTAWGTFLSVRWVHPKKTKGGEPAELEELREAGLFRVEAGHLYLTTFRRHKSSRDFQFEVVSGLGADKLVITHTRKNGSTARASYRRTV